MDSRGLGRNRDTGPHQRRLPVGDGAVGEHVDAGNLDHRVLLRIGARGFDVDHADDHASALLARWQPAGLHTTTRQRHPGGPPCAVAPVDTGQVQVGRQPPRQPRRRASYARRLIGTTLPGIEYTVCVCRLPRRHVSTRFFGISCPRAFAKSLNGGADITPRDRQNNG